MEVVERVCGLPFLRHGNGPYLLDSVSIDCTEKCGGNTVHFNSSKNSLALIHAGIKFDRYSLDYILPFPFFLFLFSFFFFSNNRSNISTDEILKSFSRSFVIELRITLLLRIFNNGILFHYRSSITNVSFPHLSKNFKSGWKNGKEGKWKGRKIRKTVGKIHGRGSCKSRCNLLTTLFVGSSTRTGAKLSERKS